MGMHKNLLAEIPAMKERLANAEVAFRHIRKNIESLFKALQARGPTPCKGCGKPIWFVTMPSGKESPYTRDALSHFADCEVASQFKGGTQNGDKK